MNPTRRGILLGRDGVINRRLGRGFVGDWQQIAGVYYTSLLPRSQCLSGRSHIQLLQLALAEHELRPEDTPFISDSPTDLAAARSLGRPTIVLCREAFLNPELFGCASGSVASNLREAAEMVIRNHAYSTRGLPTSFPSNRAWSRSSNSTLPLCGTDRQ